MLQCTLYEIPVVSRSHHQSLGLRLTRSLHQFSVHLTITKASKSCMRKQMRSFKSKHKKSLTHKYRNVKKLYIALCKSRRKNRGILLSTALFLARPPDRLCNLLKLLCAVSSFTPNKRGVYYIPHIIQSGATIAGGQNVYTEWQ